MGMLLDPTQLFPLTQSSFPSNKPAEDFGKRQDGTDKGLGWYGKLPHVSGGVATELSADSTIDGKTVHYPLLVPGLSKEEIIRLLTNQNVPDSVYDKAIQHAKWRIKQGKSPFAGPGEQLYEFPK